MGATIHDCAVAKGSVTPTTSDNAPGRARVGGDQGISDSRILGHSHEQRKDAAKLKARATLLGLVAEPLLGGEWRVNAGTGSTMHPSQQSVLALVAGIEQVRAEVGALVRSGRPSTTAAAPTAAGPDDDVAARKWFATLQARAALHGISVSHGGADNGTEVFYVSRWSFTKEMPNLAAVEKFLAVQGVRA